ncbi:MAG TPA: DUF4265 domain-containing protein [Myxococcaceae bacterium]|jgi:hypothetical protein
MSLDGLSAGHALCKVFFRLEKDAWHGSATESLWAEPAAGGRYRLRNSPFYAFGVSAEDIVFAQEEDGLLFFTEVSLRGGHSTYRIMKVKGLQSGEFERYWEPLRQAGCSYEEGPGRLLAVDVPSEADFQRVYALMEQGEKAEVWHFEEGHRGHLHPEP